MGERISNLGLSVGQKQNRTLPLIHRFAVPLPPREGKGMRKPLFLLIPKGKYRLFIEKAPISSCLPSPQGKVSPAPAAATDEGHTKGFLLVQIVR